MSWQWRTPLCAGTNATDSEKCPIHNLIDERRFSLEFSRLRGHELAGESFEARTIICNIVDPDSPFEIATRNTDSFGSQAETLDLAPPIMKNLEARVGIGDPRLDFLAR